MKMTLLALMLGFSIASVAQAKCEKVGSYAPAGDDTYAVKCDGVILKSEEILPESVADKIIAERNKEKEAEASDKAPVSEETK